MLHANAEEIDSLQETINRAQQGDADAQFLLGSMYYDGQGVPRDYKKAVYWYEKSAKQGYADAQYNLGVMYSTGRGIPQDYKLAYVWFNVASAQGYEDAKKARDIVEEYLTPATLTEAQALSNEYYKKYSAKE